MRLWIDLAVDADQRDAHDDLFSIAAAHPGVQIVGISVFGDSSTAPDCAQRALARCGIADVFVYAGTPDPRALETAEGLLSVGPLTNLAKLAKFGVDLPPLVVMEATFSADPAGAAVVLNVASDLLAVPVEVSRRSLVAAELLGLFALVGEKVVVGKRHLGVALNGHMMMEDTAGEGLVDHDVVVECDHEALAQRVESLMALHIEQ